VLAPALHRIEVTVTAQGRRVTRQNLKPPPIVLFFHLALQVFRTGPQRTRLSHHGQRLDLGHRPGSPLAIDCQAQARLGSERASRRLPKPRAGANLVNTVGVCPSPLFKAEYTDRKAQRLRLQSRAVLARRHDQLVRRLAYAARCSPVLSFSSVEPRLPFSHLGEV